MNRISIWIIVSCLFALLASNKGISQITENPTPGFGGLNPGFGGINPGIDQDVVWTDLVGVKVDQQSNAITKHAIEGWGNAGAMSENTLPASQDGSFTYTVGNAGCSFALGFSSENRDAHYTSIEAGFLIANKQMVALVEGEPAGQYVPCQPGDLIMMQRVGDNTILSLNNKPVMATPTDASKAVKLDLAIHTQNCIITGIKTSFGSQNVDIDFSVQGATCDNQEGGAIILDVSGGQEPYAFSWSNGSTSPGLSGIGPGVNKVSVTDINGQQATQTIHVGYDPVWTDLDGTTVSAANTLIKTGQTSWLTGGAASTEGICMGECAMMQITDPGIEFSFGLSVVNEDASWETIDYSFRVINGVLYYTYSLEPPVQIFNTGTKVQEGDLLELCLDYSRTIDPQCGPVPQMQLKLNGNLIQAFENFLCNTQTGQFAVPEFLIDVTIHQQGDMLSGIQFKQIDPQSGKCFCSEPGCHPGSGPSYTWNGSVNTSWALKSNWTPAGVPDIGDNVTIVSAPNICILDEGRTIQDICVLSGELDLNGHNLDAEGYGTFLGGLVNNTDGGLLTLDRNHKMTYYGGTEFNAELYNRCSEIYLNGSIFNNTSYFELFEPSLSQLFNDGGNVFNGNTTIVLSVDGPSWYLANIVKDIFNGPVTFRNTIAGTLGAAYNTADNEFNDVVVAENTGIGDITFAHTSNAANTVFQQPVHLKGIGSGSSRIIVSLDGPNTLVNDHIIVSADQSGSVLFGEGSGNVVLKDGFTVSESSGGFLGTGQLSFRNFLQAGTTPQDLTVAGNASLYIRSGAVFEGPIDFKAFACYLNGGIFQHTALLKQTGGNDVHCLGGNIFQQDVTITNTGSANWYLADDAGGSRDEFRSLAVFEQPGTGNIYPSGRFEDIYLGDIRVSGASPIIFGINQGIAQMNGPVPQAIDADAGSAEPIFKKLRMEKTLAHVTLNTPITIGNASGDFVDLVDGHLNTDPVNLVTIADDAIAVNASDQSFVSGPVSKVGDDPFFFPTGKGGNYLPIGISAPGSVSDRYTAEYFDMEQQLGAPQAPLTFVSSCEYWTLTRPAAYSTNVDVSVSWNNKSCDILADLTKLEVAELVGNDWVTRGHGGYTGSALNGGTVTNDDPVNNYNAFVLASNIRPCSEDPLGIYLNNYGAGIYIEAGAQVNVMGNVWNDDAGSEKGEFEHYGTIELTGSWTNHSDNNVFTVSAGLVDMIGSDQYIRGSWPTQFHDLKLSGLGTKYLCLDAMADNKLYLENSQLATQEHTMYVNTTDPLAIERSTGYVSSDNYGFLKRDMDQVSTYPFPVGAKHGGQLRYRPLDITPATANDHTYQVRMVDEDPDPLYDRSTRSQDIEIINEHYYHVIDRLTGPGYGTDPADLTFYFNETDDGLLQSVGHWDDQPLSPTPIPPAPPLWKNTGNITLTPVSALFPPLDKAVTTAGWNDFFPEIFALVKAGFVINTNDFGDPDGDGNGVTFVVNGGNLPDNDGSGSGGSPFDTPNGNSDGSGGELITDDQLGGDYTITILEGNGNTGTDINIVVDNSGTVSDPTVTGDDGNDYPLADDLYDIVNGTTFVLNSTPAPDGPVCNDDIVIKLTPLPSDPVDDPILFSLPADRFNVLGIEPAAEPYLKLDIYDRSGSLVKSVSGADVINLPWDGTDQFNVIVNPGVYLFDLDVGIKSGGTYNGDFYTFTGQFLVQ